MKHRATRRPVVFAVDETYLTPLRIAIESVTVACRPDVAELRIIVLHEGIGESTRRSLNLGHHVEWRDISLPANIALPITEWMSRATYYRLAIGEAIPDYDSCLYLDADILVLESVARLLTRRLGPPPVAAVRDAFNPILLYGRALPCWRELGLAEDREYFNSGVMLLNLDACRDQRLFERAWEFIETRPECVHYWDQDALNWAVDDDWERLDRRWNTFAMSALLQTPGIRFDSGTVLPLDVLVADETSARILHFAGGIKPWHPDFPKGRARDSYTEFLRKLEL